LFDDPVRLERLQAEIALKRSALAEHLAQVTRLQREVALFANEYDRVVGKLQDQLDAVCQQIESLKQASESSRFVWGETYNSLEEQFERYRQPQAAPPVRRVADDSTLRTVYRRLARRYHPDTAIDPAEKARLTVIMARINAAYRAKNIDELYALEKSPNAAAANKPLAPIPAGPPTFSDLLKLMNQLDDQITDAKIAYQALVNSPLMLLKIEASLAKGRKRDLLQEVAVKVRAELNSARQELVELQRKR